MAENLVVEAPDFDRIDKGDPKATKNAILLLWTVLNYEIKTRIKQVREAKDLTEGAVLSVAWTADQHNLDPGEGRTILSTGTTAVDITGFSGGREGRVLILHVVGSASITLSDLNANSYTTNQIVTVTGGDTTVKTDETAILQYLNSRWRMWSVQ